MALKDQLAKLAELNKARATQGYKPVDAGNTAAVEAGFQHGAQKGYYKPEAPQAQPEPAPLSEDDQIRNQFKGLGYTDQDYEDYKRVDPNKNVLEQIYTKTIKKPDPISENGMRAARTASQIGDSLGVIAEMVASGRGAHIKPRDFNNSSTAQESFNERNVRNLYEQRLAQYNSGLANAQVGDMSREESQRMQLRHNMLSSLANKRKLDQDTAEKAADYRLKLMDLGMKGQSLDNEMKRFNAKLKEDARHNRNVEANDKAKLNVEKADKFNGLVINAHESDNKATTDAAGNRIVQYKMTKQQINNIAATAKRDRKFMDEHQEELSVTKPDMFGTPHKGLDSDETVARAYQQYKYNQGFQESEKPVQQIETPGVPTNKSNKQGKSRL